MLVSDEEGTIALIAVEEKSGKVNGIVQRGDGSRKFTQTKGKKVSLFVIFICVKLM